MSTAVLAQAPVNKKPLGPEINTKAFRELLPLVSADGQTLYFTREDKGEVAAAAMQAQIDAKMAEMKAMLDTLDPATRAQLEKALGQNKPRSITPSGQMHQTIYASRRGADGRWGRAEKLPPPLSHDAITLWAGSVLPDNNTLLVAGGLVSNPLDFAARAKEAEAAAAAAGGDLMRVFDRAAPGGKGLDVGDKSRLFAWAKRTASGWTAPEPIRLKDFRNTSDRIDLFLAPDGTHLVLSIVNAESIGMRDLYVSSLGADGVWQKPRNLGAAVNSRVDEISPFVAPDGQTMYFASNRPGSRKFDIWMTRRLDQSWQTWSPPVNMGAEINTDQDDMNLAVDAVGQYAFMSIGPLGEEDIYEFALPAALRPRPVAFVRGKVTDPAGKPLPASILYEFLRDGNGAGQANSAPADGRYQIALPIGEDYAFRGSAAGYIAVSDRLDLRATKEAAIVERDLILVPIEVGQTIRLNNIFFDTAKAVLLPESRRELDRLVQLLQAMPSLRIEVRGHTDAVDATDVNQQLSEARAAAVVAYLAGAGIQPARLASRGFGESQPIAPNNTDKGRQQNRRVEFTVVSR
ncbi:MAG: OmpA family protein [Acidobacteriota bacterium]|nr:OmpA family protein [Acidobacteriota bacterium]